MTLGDRIRYRRIDLDMTQEELGEKVGLKKSAVNKYEKGVVINMKRDMIAKMAAALDVSPIWLLGLEEEQQKQDEEEGRLLSLFRSMNDHGRAYLLQTAELAAQAPIYKNHSAIPDKVI